MSNDTLPPPAGTVTVETTHAPQLVEADIESPPNDHLGDYVETMSPYQHAVAAQRQTAPLPSDVHADPADVHTDFARFGTTPYSAPPVKPVACDEWSANDWFLADGVNLPQRVAHYDPYRKRVTVINASGGDVYISPNPNGTAGFGSITILSGQRIELEVRAEVWLFTVTGYVSASLPVSVVCERYA